MVDMFFRALLSDNMVNWSNQIFIFVPNTWSCMAFLTKTSFVRPQSLPWGSNCVRFIHWSFPHPLFLHLSEKMTYTRIYPHYPPKWPKNGGRFHLSQRRNNCFVHFVKSSKECRIHGFVIDFFVFEQQCLLSDNFILAMCTSRLRRSVAAVAASRKERSGTHTD